MMAIIIDFSGKKMAEIRLALAWTVSVENTKLILLELEAFSSAPIILPFDGASD